MINKLNERVGRSVFNIYFATKKFRRTDGWRTGYRMQYRKGNVPVWYPGGDEFGWGWSSVKSDFPDYSGEIEHVWDIVKEMKERFDLQLMLVTERKYSTAMFRDMKCKIVGWGEAKTECEAICLSALQVMKKKKLK